MKANELCCKDLMVGDYLMYNGFPYRVIQVDGIVRDGWMIENGEEDCGEPIPLTPEILEKYGFVVESRYCHGNPLQYCVLVDGLWIDISGENYFEGKLEYIHQLQQALRLCGIEKEIELH